MTAPLKVDQLVLHQAAITCDGSTTNANMDSFVGDPSSPAGSLYIGSGGTGEYMVGSTSANAFVTLDDLRRAVSSSGEVKLSQAQMLELVDMFRSVLREEIHRAAVKKIKMVKRKEKHARRDPDRGR